MKRRPRKFANVYIKNLAKAHHRLHPREQVRSRPDQPFAWHDEGAERVDRLEVVPHSASSKLFFPRMATVCVVAIFFMVTDIKVSDIFFHNQGVSLTGNGSSLVSDGVCEHHTESHAKL